MKHIHKSGEPRELRMWRDGQPLSNGARINCAYDNMPGNVKQAVKTSLLQEQGYLCCYTGKAVNEATSHVEHFKPQSQCVGNDDIDYNNLLAAYPGGTTVVPYGAQAKADWFDPKMLVSPFHTSCEQRFKFSQFGKISATKASDKAATETIRRLNLDHEELNDERKQTIQKTLIGLKLSAKQLQQITSMYGRITSDGHYRSYCFVIIQVAQILLKKAETKAKVRKHINKADKGKRKPK